MVNQPTAVQSGERELCGWSKPVLLRDANPTRRRTLACPHCRLIFASPKPSPQRLEHHDEHEFKGDAGGQARAADAELEKCNVEAEERRARSWAAPLVQRFLDPSGKVVLDLRSRSGAIAAVLHELGADVRLTDPFEANVCYAREKRALPNASQLPASQFHNLPGETESCDATTALHEHVAAHVVNCRLFLDRAFSLLKTGGYLFLDEKDVLKPARYKCRQCLTAARRISITSRPTP